MRNEMIEVDEGFWNIRGSFKIAGLLDIGTQMSLVRRGNGKFVLLDTCPLGEQLAGEIARLTRDGKDLEAILNLHPFHTMNVAAIQRRYPHARLYGTARHLARYPELPWQELRTEDPKLHTRFARDFAFSVPRGVDFVSANENVHFSSVLALHRASGTIHVDDTLMYTRLPLPARALGFEDFLGFHPTLPAALEKREGAAREFRSWADELAQNWRDARNLCAAHTAVLSARENRGASIHGRLLSALRKAGAFLKAHECRYG